MFLINEEEMGESFGGVDEAAVAVVSFHNQR